MAELKTRPSKRSATAFVAGLRDPRVRKDCTTLMRLMKRATRARPVMWGSSIVGFGDREYGYASGRSVAWFEAGFSPRKANLTIYLMGGAAREPALRKRLGKHTTGVGCLYVKRLDDIDLGVLERLVASSVKAVRARFSS
jgi:hypothetical protein